MIIDVIFLLHIYLIYFGAFFKNASKTLLKTAIYPTNSGMCEVINAEVELQNPPQRQNYTETQWKYFICISYY